MYQRYKERFGTAGVVVGVIALVLALVTGAYAAGGGLSGKQKKEVKAIAKSFQGTGPAGAAGTAGTNGANGKDGINGTNGNPGAPGAEGKSVEAESAGAKCAEGGTVFKIGGVEKGKACNGEEGPAGPEGVCSTSSCHLPVDVTEKGAWEVTGTAEDAFGLYAPISFNIPLSADLAAANVHISSEANFADFDGAGPNTIGCTGSEENPTAPSGNLCVYDAGGFGVVFAQIDKLNGLTAGASAAGAFVQFEAPTGPAIDLGSWAVTG